VATGPEIFQGIAVDASGNASITGTTYSSAFPTTSGAYQTTLPSGAQDAFVTKLNASGSALTYSSLLGNRDTTDGRGIALDSSGQAVITGYTQSFGASPGFPTTTGAYQTTSGGNGDAFVTKFNSSGSGLVYSTFLGASGSDSGQAVALDGSGNVYVAGVTDATSGTAFPTTSGAYQTTFGSGNSDAFVTKLNSSASALDYSTLLGRSSNTSAYGIAVDGSGNAYVTGATYSSDFPVTAGAYQATLAGSQNAFVGKFTTTGSAAYVTYLGGSSSDQGNGIAVPSAGQAVVVGSTCSSDFPTVGAVQSNYGGNGDAFLSVLGAGGSALVSSTFLGGSSGDSAAGVALGSTGLVYVAGTTAGTDFPTANAWQSASGGNNDAFVAKLDLSTGDLHWVGPTFTWSNNPEPPPTVTNPGAVPGARPYWFD
jgi:hypothetical protein